MYPNQEEKDIIAIADEKTDEMWSAEFHSGMVEVKRTFKVEKS